MESFFKNSKSAALLKKRFWSRCFIVSFAEILKTLFYKTLSDNCFFSEICVIFKNAYFGEHMKTANSDQG